MTSDIQVRNESTRMLIDGGMMPRAQTLLGKINAALDTETDPNIDLVELHLLRASLSLLIGEMRRIQDISTPPKSTYSVDASDGARLILLAKNESEREAIRRLVGRHGTAKDLGIAARIFDRANQPDRAVRIRQQVCVSGNAPRGSEDET